MPDAKSTDTRSRILEAGSEAIVAKSFNGCGLNEILAAAGVPKGSFYHYFKSKEDFGVAVVDHAAEQHVASMRAFLEDRTDPPLERVEAFFEMVRDCFAESGGADNECIISKFALEAAQCSDSIRAAVRRSFAKWSAVLAAALREAQERGDLAANVRPEQVADFLINFLQGVTIRMQIERDTRPIDDFIERLKAGAFYSAG